MIDYQLLISAKLQSNALSVKDREVDFPDEFDFRETKSLGMQIANNLVTQLDGAIDMISGEGTEVRIQF